MTQETRSNHELSRSSNRHSMSSTASTYRSTVPISSPAYPTLPVSPNHIAHAPSAKPHNKRVLNGLRESGKPNYETDDESRRRKSRWPTDFISAPPLVPSTLKSQFPIRDDGAHPPPKPSRSTARPSRYEPQDNISGHQLLNSSNIFPQSVPMYSRGPEKASQDYNKQPSQRTFNSPILHQPQLQAPIRPTTATGHRQSSANYRGYYGNGNYAGQPATRG